VNITPLERGARIVVGTLGLFGVVAWLVLAPSMLAAVATALLAMVGVDLIVTGARGYCPVYAWMARRASGGTAR
jgi:DUF2892 family protein